MGKAHGTVGNPPSITILGSRFSRAFSFVAKSIFDNIIIKGTIKSDNGLGGISVLICAATVTTFIGAVMCGIAVFAYGARKELEVKIFVSV